MRPRQKRLYEEERKKRGKEILKGEKGGGRGEKRGGLSQDSAADHPPVHDALQDGSKGRDANARPDEHGMLRGEDPAGGGSIRAIDVALCTREVGGKRVVSRCGESWTPRF